MATLTHEGADGQTHPEGRGGGRAVGRNHRPPDGGGRQGFSHVSPVISTVGRPAPTMPAASRTRHRRRRRRRGRYGRVLGCHRVQRAVTEGLGADRRSRTRTTMSGFFNFRKTVRCRVRFRFMRRLYNLSSLAISILQTPVAQSNQVAINENDASMLFSVKCL